PAKRYHEAIFVEENSETLDGTMFHVTGDVISSKGMYYQERWTTNPRNDRFFHRLTPLGWVDKTDYDSGRIGEVLKALPTPPKQQGLDFWAKKEEGQPTPMIWTKENGEPYAPGEERRPVFKCNEWLSQCALPALREAGLI
ncbi:hypothetical protein BDZ85DRAFT_180444, partial [Elsinoe ampelina]